MLASVTKRQIEQGEDVTIYYLARDDTPSDADVRALLHPDVHLIIAERQPVRMLAYLNLAYDLRVRLKSSEFDLVHLHSSIAGAIGRLSGILLRNRITRLVYSPHGFAFLRQNTSKLVQFATKWIEKTLTRYCDALILTSKSEQLLAINSLGARNTFLLKTGIDPTELAGPTIRSKPEDNSRLRVGMVGRVCYQKAPWRFVKVAEQLSEKADFLWIGDGNKADVNRWFGTSDVTVLGWLPGEKLNKALDSLDVLLFPTLWEGMSMALMQAQARGIPAVVSNAVGNVDSVAHGRTGYICSTDEEMIEKVDLLLANPLLRDSMSAAAKLWASDELTDLDVGKDSVLLYHAIMQLEAAYSG